MPSRCRRSSRHRWRLLSRLAERRENRLVIDDPDDGDEEMREQDELQPDLDILHEYADTHSDVWGGLEFAAVARLAPPSASATVRAPRWS